MNGWICALHAGDWAVLDRQFQSETDESLTEFFSRCALVQALYQVAGEAGKSEQVLEKLTGYGVKKTDPTFKAFFEVLGLVTGAKSNSWKDNLQTLDADQKTLAQAEMASGLAGALELLAKVESTTGQASASRHTRISDLTRIWKHPLARELSARVLTAVMDDDSGLFLAANISTEERVRLMMKTFDWQPVKSCIETRFEGELEIALLTELALDGYPTSDSQDDFKAFIENLAPRVTPGSQAASNLWLKVAQRRLLVDDLEGGKAARVKINTAHLKDYEVSRLDRQIDGLVEKIEKR